MGIVVKSLVLHTHTYAYKFADIRTVCVGVGGWVWGYIGLEIIDVVLYWFHFNNLLSTHYF